VYENGLVTKSSAPRSKPRTRSISLERPVSTTSGSRGSIREATPSEERTRRIRSSPEPSGSPRSTIARSGARCSSARSASRSESATTNS
jgi:hypothetical protein